jgi:hypothetical protein
MPASPDGASRYTPEWRLINQILKSWLWSISVGEPTPTRSRIPLRRVDPGDLALAEITL